MYAAIRPRAAQPYVTLGAFGLHRFLGVNRRVLGDEFCGGSQHIHLVEITACIRRTCSLASQRKAST